MGFALYPGGHGHGYTFVLEEIEVLPRLFDRIVRRALVIAGRAPLNLLPDMKPRYKSSRARSA